MAETQLVTAVGVGNSFQPGNLQIANLAIGVSFSGLLSLSVGRQVIYDPSQGTPQPFYFSVIDWATPRNVPFRFGSGSLTFVTRTFSSFVAGFPVVGNLADEVKPRGFVSAVFGKNVLRPPGNEYVADFNFIEQMKSYINVPFIFGGDYNFVIPGYGATLFGFPAVDNLADEIKPRGFVSVTFGKTVIRPPGNEYVADFNFVEQMKSNINVPFIFDGEYNFVIPGYKATLFGNTYVRNYAQSIAFAGLEFLTFGRNTAVAFAGADVPLTIWFYGNYQGFRNPKNVGFYFVNRSRVLDATLGAQTLFGAFHVAGEERTLDLQGFDAALYGLVSVTEIKPTQYVLVSGFDRLEIPVHKIKWDKFLTFTGTEFLVVPTLSLRANSYLSVEGWFNDQIFGLPAFESNAQVAQIYGFLAGYFGYASAKANQVIVPQGRRQAVFGPEWAITQTGPRRVWPASYYLPNMPLSTRVWNAQQFVRFESAFNKWYDDFGEETLVEYLLPKVPKFTGTEFTEFGDSDFGEHLFVSHRIRRINPAFIYNNVFGDWKYSIRQFVDVPWSIHTSWGLPKVVRYLEAFPDGYTMTEFGKWSWDFDNVIIFGQSEVDSVFSTPDVKRGLEYIRFGEFHPFTEFSPALVWNSTQFILHDDVDEANDLLKMSDGHFVWNKNYEIFAPGFSSFTSKPWLHNVYNNAVQFPTTSITSLEFGERTFVAYRVRDLPLPSFTPTTYSSGNMYVWNYAFVIAPDTIISDGVIGEHQVVDTTQWLTFRNYALPLEFGRPFVADRIRYINVKQHPEDPDSEFSVPLVGLLEQYVIPESIAENPPLIWPNIGWATVEELPPRYIGANPLRPFFEVEHYGLFGIKNVDRAYQWFAHYQPYPGFPTVQLHTRYIETNWDKANRFGSTTRVSDLEQTVKFLAGLNSLIPPKIMTRLDRVPNDPPRTEQTVHMRGWTDLCHSSTCPMDFGQPLVRGQVIFVDSEYDLFTRFGAADLTVQTMGVRSYKDFLEMGYGWFTSHRHRKVEMVGGLDTIDKCASVFSDRPARIDPRWVFMRNERDLLPYDYYGEGNAAWAPLDSRIGDHGYGKGPGRPTVRLKHRVIQFSGYRITNCGNVNYNCFGSWKLTTKPLYVTFGEGISSLARGQLTIIPHKKRVFFAGFIDSLFGEPTVTQEYVAPPDRAVSFNGLSSFVAGALDPQNWIREIYPQGHVDTGNIDPNKYPASNRDPSSTAPIYLWGKNNPMVYHYPRGFVTTGGSMTQWGTTWLSHNPRYYVLTAGEQTLWDWEDFRLKMTVTRGRGKITPSGFDSLSFGTPGNALGTRYVSMYMIAPPCVIGLNSIDHQ
jgi:hypothetical protein